jgi:hypothetical protein
VSRAARKFNLPSRRTIGTKIFRYKGIPGADHVDPTGPVWTKRRLGEKRAAIFINFDEELE